MFYGEDVVRLYLEQEKGTAIVSIEREAFVTKYDAYVKNGEVTQSDLMELILELDREKKIVSVVVSPKEMELVLKEHDVVFGKSEGDTTIQIVEETERGDEDEDA